MKRRALIVGAAAAVVTATIPPAPIAATAKLSTSALSEAVEWFRVLRSLTYELRKQYVANLRADPCGSNPKMVRLIDLVEEMNERGSFT